MKIKLKLKKLIRGLDYDDPYYMDKLYLLFNLLSNPDIGHIVSGDIVDWCKEKNLKPKSNCEDGAAWWTCSAK